MHKEGLADLEEIENWWVDRIRDFFDAKPFELRYDKSKSLRAMVQDLLTQADKRQKENPGTQYAGAVSQHLVGAKLSLVLPNNTIDHHGYYVSDSASARYGDFNIDDSVIHVTVAPGEALMRKCADNLSAGYQPIIVTVYANMSAAESLARIKGIAGRVDLLDAEQFIATNLYELSSFKSSDKKVTISKLGARYNEIVGKCETDPSLRLTMG